MSHLEGGLCVCGNSTFEQITVVTLNHDTYNFQDEDGRWKRWADTLLKKLRCPSCGAEFVYSPSDNDWKSG